MNNVAKFASTRVTYSPKVFIPLTTLCRDRCGYCTFAQSPAHVAPYLTLDQVVEIARAGAELGCHEALFTLGEAPEDRYPVARDWLDEHGYSSTIDYLVAACQAVLDETGLLPHANAGAISREDLARLRKVAPSQGMMIETLRGDLAAHRGAPDKTPERRLATLEFAGELRIPFTTGILVGIGETREDRIEALEAIAASHARHGHVQEVIVQNFMPKSDTVMRLWPACPEADHLDAIALARAILPADVHVQAPPNLVEDAGSLLEAGIDDFGGISPITADHVNPERPWPQIEDLRAIVESRGRSLVPRLTIHPEFARNPDVWIDPALHFAVQDRGDAEALGRDDVGAMFPERYAQAANVGTGPEVVQIGRRSTSWYSGSDRLPGILISNEPAAEVGGAVGEVLQGVRAGQVPGESELVTLFESRGAEVRAIAALADQLRAAVSGEVVTYVRNRNINYTNVCTFKCTFCAFSKGPATLNLRGAPYLLTTGEVAARAVEAVELGATEVCLQGGIHPDFNGQSYLDILAAVRDAAPSLHLHAFSALEVWEGARRLGIPLREFLTTLREAGLKSLPGTAAEILDDEIRAIICPDKVNTEQWLEVHETAHEVGLRSNITIMFGSVERPVHWARHLIRTRELQARTQGFTEFVPLPFVHMAAPMYLKKGARRGPTWRETVLMHAVGRIAYHGSIDNIQASWVKLGTSGAQQLLRAGVNDLGGTLMDENISRAAGATHGQGITVEEFAAIAEPIGRSVQERSTLYVPIGVSVLS
ncbi:MAG: 5-amino-6-(D-ribitylamino)uracil--L-tyrosine 4-hydroxyphenyl transferase CofH [Actinomycetota bacterium]|nr:5-amino-6-(D-ribitylamino)uracil--L-tyrosine 4-hydroxyphenyl transferase CofH [Actinomycetota bacterium]